MVYGYLTSNGYYGMVEGRYMLFATEDEYREYLATEYECFGTTAEGADTNAALSAEPTFYEYQTSEDGVMVNGYHSEDGFYGMVDGKYMLFETPEKYLEFLEERENDDDKE